MKQGASYAIEVVEDNMQDVTLESIRQELGVLTPYPWFISNTHFPDKEVLYNKSNKIIIYFATGLGCIYLENYNTKQHSALDILPTFSVNDIAQLINFRLKRMVG
ncbi:unnamed protein product [Commensalibacter communis]|uniref:Uncharacterized protein n=3 Tax=Commensalibacter communis TaxID=2972786 RepID=A0A9W4TPA9_9PROT|nr:hypothetical protein [Commensalibacter communis]CAI3957797.1 unnamed protein product [Commensalibacter communis]CAI3960351.1 unnamed protein product [Commensalibacter communis]